MVAAAGTPLLSDFDELWRPRWSSALRGHRRPGARRRVHEIRTVPLPLLVAQRDAGTDTRERLPAFRNDGEGWRVPRRTHDADPRRRADLDWHDHRDRHANDGDRRDPRTARDGPEACARVLHDQRSGDPDAAVRDGVAASGHCWLGLSARACLLQRSFVPRGGSSRARDRHARRGVTGRTAPNDAADRCRGRAGRRVDGRHPAVLRFHREGAVLRKRPHVGASRRLEWHPHRAGRGGEHVPRRGGIHRRHCAVSWPFDDHSSVA